MDDVTKRIAWDAEYIRTAPSGTSATRRPAGRVLVIIAYRDLAGVLHGVNAWPATGTDLAAYEGTAP